MRVVPERHFALQLVAVFGGFLIGPYVALRAAVALAPESGLVHGVSVMGFALIFMGGVLTWLGVGVFVVAVAFFASLLRGRRPGPAPGLAADERYVPPGDGAFVVVGVAVGLAVGLLAGLATDLSLPFATAVWAGLGLAYGLLLRTAAHHGYLPFDPE